MIDNKPKVTPTAITSLSENVESRTDHGWPDIFPVSMFLIVYYYGCYETNVLLDNNLMVTEISLVTAHLSRMRCSNGRAAGCNPVASASRFDPYLIHQPSDELVQFERNSKCRGNCRNHSQRSSCRNLGSGRKPNETGMPNPSEA